MAPSVMSEPVGISINRADSAMAAIRSCIWTALCETGFGCAALVSLVAVVLAIVTQLLWFQRRKLNLPPGPRPWPIIGSLHLLGTHPDKSFAELARKYGPVMSVRLGQRYCVVATSPEAAREFLKHQDANFCARPRKHVADIVLHSDFAWHTMTPVLRHVKKIFVSELTTAKRLEASKHIRAEEVAYMLRGIAKETGPIGVKSYLDIMSTNILSRMIFSKRFLGVTGSGNELNVSEFQEYMEIREEFRKCFGATHLQDVFDFIPKWFDPQGLDARCHKLKARLDAFCTNIFSQHKEERRKNPVSEGQKTMLDVLLEQIDIPELQVTEEHVKGALWDTMLAGTDTSTVTSEWAMTEVLRNPTLMKNARLELDHVVGLNRTVRESDIPNLKYIRAIIKETLRFHTVTPLLLPHESINATEVFGYDIPAKARLFVNIGSIGRDPSIWKNPMEFMPERFLDGAPHEMIDLGGQHFELLPFGSGRRMCPGMAFGLIALHLQVANLLHAFDWSLPDGMAPEKLDMSDGQFGVTVPKRDPLVAAAKPRLPSHLYED